jgi:hypothetical protein
VDVGAAVVADEQSFELVQPRERALDDPAVTAETRAVLGLASCDLGLDWTLSGRRRGRPILPRTGGTRSTSGISWVLS